MKIFGSDPDYLKKNRVGDSGKARSTEAKSAEAAKAKLAGESTQVSGEKIAVSDLGKEIAKVNSEVKASPDIRTEKVAEIKERVDSGEYHVPADKIAGKIIEDIIKMG